MMDKNGRWKPYAHRDKYPCVINGVACEKRYIGCQDTCSKMLAAKIVNESRKAIERRERDKDHSVSAIKQHGYCTVKRVKPKER